MKRMDIDNNAPYRVPVLLGDSLSTYLKVHQGRSSSLEGEELQKHAHRNFIYLGRNFILL